MLRLIKILMLLALALATEPAAAQRLSPSAIPFASAVSEPARLCGTNSSRSRRCFFGNRECLGNGHSHADCQRALAICHSCIDIMVTCARQPANSCGVCTERYDTCMQPWINLIE